MGKYNSIAAILVSIQVFIFLFCTDPSNPFDNSNNVKITVSVPVRPDSLLWKVNDSVSIEVGVYLNELVDSIALEFGENDSVLVFLLPEGLKMDDTVFFTLPIKKQGRRQ